MSEPSALLAAIYAGNTDDARAIAATRDIDACEAAALGDVTALNDAIARDATAAATYSADGWTPLHLAGFFGQDACAAALLAAGASLSALSRNSTANTPLHAALAGRVNHALVQRLIDAGADVNARGEAGIRPLHLAASRGDVAMCELLLARGAKRSARMEDGTTASEMAEKRGFPEAAAILAG